MHSGIDIAATTGTNFKAIINGKVHSIKGNSSDSEGAGLRVYIKARDKLGNTIYYGFCHLSEVNVSVNDSINQGSIVGKSGTSGNAINIDIPHCHLIVYDQNFVNQLNPQLYIKSQFNDQGERIE